MTCIGIGDDECGEILPLSSCPRVHKVALASLVTNSHRGPTVQFFAVSRECGLGLQAWGLVISGDHKREALSTPRSSKSS